MYRLGGPRGYSLSWMGAVDTIGLLGTLFYWLPHAHADTVVLPIRLTPQTVHILQFGRAPQFLGGLERYEL